MADEYNYDIRHVSHRRDAAFRAGFIQFLVV